MAAKESAIEKTSLESLRFIGSGNKKKKRRDERKRPEKAAKKVNSMKKKTAKRLELSSSSGNKVKNIMELAKMVSSGKVKVPQSLVNYIDDRTLLLDQLFTILTPDDIRGMLPDTLKELKLKVVKQLCFEQLKSLQSERITKIILGEYQLEKDVEFSLNGMFKEERHIGSSQSHLKSTTNEEFHQTQYLSSFEEDCDVSTDEECIQITPVYVNVSKDSNTILSEGNFLIGEELTIASNEMPVNMKLGEEKYVREKEDWSMDSAQAFELLLRQRALEAEIRRWRSDEGSMVKEIDGAESVIEQRLRQKALESMIKNKQKVFTE